MKFKNKEVLLKDIKVVEEIIENEKVVNIQTFNDPTDAIKAFYIDENKAQPLSPQTDTSTKSAEDNKDIQGISGKSVIAYTDGSWDPNNNSLGAGVVLFYKQKSKIKQQTLKCQRKNIV
ncbi:hypothetical protein [Lactiplantibacillus plantarum]|uniref:hypothetical protein n=1 Tax=Lactiplantibacillus plantarum TaxID=1590 RepID=UPI001BA4EEE2|nr:hypothetical protein [Lactiplantibacillus plantarum]MBS0946068.1 hypothetical protein [Lactiplantibacillus plantarum]